MSPALQLDSLPTELPGKPLRNLLGWPKKSFGFFCNIVQKKPNFLVNPVFHSKGGIKLQVFISVEENKYKISVNKKFREEEMLNVY